MQYTIIEYVGEGLRPIQEGESVLNAEHIVMCGIKEKTNNNVCYHALCLQTSKLSGPPHKLSVTITPDTCNWICTCSCKAGAGGKCKHIVAVLLYLNRNTDVEVLSCTDIEQAWGKLKKAIPSLEVMPLQEFCHVPKANHNSKYSFLSKEYLESVCQNLLSAVPNSEAALHRKGSRKKPDAPISHVENTIANLSPVTAIVNKILFNKLTITFDSIKMNKEEEQYYNKNVMVAHHQALELACSTISQDCHIWHYHRRQRITGTKCYQLYTYFNNQAPIWDKKLSNIINNFKGNIYTNHGKQYEMEAVEEYRKQFEEVVVKVGFIVHPDIPWLGISSDGLIVEDEHLVRILEVKCPYLGKMKTACEVILLLPYLSVNNDVKQKKNTHITDKYSCQCLYVMLAFVI